MNRISSRSPAIPFTITSRRRVRRWPRWGGLGLGLMIVLVIGFRLALPTLVHDYVNRTLDHIPPYHGEVGDIRIHLWRGAYEIDHLRLVKTDGKVPVPFFSADRVDLSVRWAALIHGAFVGKVILDRPQLNFVASANDHQSQSGIAPSWSDQFAKLFPLKLDEVTIHRGEVWFHNFESHPPVNLKVDQLEGVARNLTNSQHLGKSLVASIRTDGRLMESGRLHAEVESNILEKPPTFEMKVSVDNLAIPNLNDFFKAYANVTAESGSFSLYAEIRSDRGNYNGYCKPLIDHLQILDFSKDTDPLHLVWESVVSVFVEAFKNQPKDRLATRIPISGSVHDLHFGVIDAIFNVFRNAFIRSFAPGFEQILHGDEPQATPAPASAPSATSSAPAASTSPASSSSPGNSGTGSGSGSASSSSLHTR